MMKDSEFLSWIADRLEFVHGEPANIDFMLHLRSIAAGLSEGEKRQNPADDTTAELARLRAQITQLQAYNNEQVERRREAESKLSIRTPPTDAELREAMEIVGEGTSRRHDSDYVGFQVGHLRTLLRAVQAPRLTGEQVEVARKFAKMLRGECASCFHVDGRHGSDRSMRCKLCLRNKHDSNWEPDQEYIELCAALGVEEVGRG